MSVLQPLTSPNQRNLSALGQALDQTSISSSSSSAAAPAAAVGSSSAISSSMTAPTASSSMAVSRIKTERELKQPQAKDPALSIHSFQPSLAAGKSPKKRERNESLKKSLSHQPATQRQKSSPSSSSSSTDNTPRNNSENTNTSSSAPTTTNVLLPSKDRSGRSIKDNATMLKQTPPAKEKSNPRRWSKAEDESLRLAVERSGERNWKAIADQVPGRNHTQCLQRWTKVLKPGLIKGHWTPEEDAKLKELVAEGKKNWGQVASLIPGRTSKQCRERWCNHLDPNINKGTYTKDEDRIILDMQAKLGNRWSIIAQQLKGRTEDAVKIRWKSLMRGKRGSPSSREDRADSQGSDSASVASNKTPRASKSRSGSTPRKHQKTASPKRPPPMSSSPVVNSQARVNQSTNNTTTSSPTVMTTPSNVLPSKMKRTTSSSSTISTSQVVSPPMSADTSNPPVPTSPSQSMQPAMTYPTTIPTLINHPQPSSNRPQINVSITGAPPQQTYANVTAFAMNFQPGSNPVLVPTTTASYGNTSGGFPTSSGPVMYSSVANPVFGNPMVNVGGQQMNPHVYMSNGRPISLAPAQGYPVPNMPNMNFPVYPVLSAPGSNGVPVQPTIPMPMVPPPPGAGAGSGVGAGPAVMASVPVPLQHPIVSALREETGSRASTPREEWGSHSTPQPQMPLADGHTSGYELFHQQRLRLIMKERERQELALSSAPSPGQAMLTKELQANKERQKRQAIMQKGWKSAVEAMMSFSDLSTQEEQQRYDGMLEKVGLSTLDPTDDDLIGNTVDEVGSAGEADERNPESIYSE